MEKDIEGEGDDMDDEDHVLNPPCVGDEFDSIEEAYQYYSLYAKQARFGVFKRSRHKKRGTNQVHQYVFACGKCRTEARHIE